MIPYFNLLLVGFSAIPIVRSNLAMAKRSLAYMAQCLGTGECISIAPEGTRSKNGHLLDFKKGPFHTWDHLQVPVVPVVITGAYELYPPGHQMNLPGVVHCRFLKPIQCSEADTREKMTVLVRQRMLHAIKSSPTDAAAPISWSFRLFSMSAIAAIWAADVYLYLGAKQLVGQWGISSKQLLYGFGAFSVLISPTVYVYAVYLMPAASALIARFKLKSASNTKKNK